MQLICNLHSATYTNSYRTQWNKNSPKCLQQLHHQLTLHLTSWSRAYLSRAGVHVTSLAATNVESIMTLRQRWCILYSSLMADSRRDSRTCLTNDVSRAVNCDCSPSHNSLISHAVTDAGRCGCRASSSLDSRSAAVSYTVSISLLQSGLDDRKPRLDNWWCMPQSRRSVLVPLVSSTFIKNTASWLLVCRRYCRRLTSCHSAKYSCTMHIFTEWNTHIYLYNVHMHFIACIFMVVTYTVWVKKSSSLKLFGKLSWLLPNHILTFTPSLTIYVNSCMNCITFTSKTLKF